MHPTQAPIIATSKHGNLKVHLNLFFKTMDDSSYIPNFDLGTKNEIHYYLTIGLRARDFYEVTIIHFMEIKSE